MNPLLWGATILLFTSLVSAANLDIGQEINEVCAEIGRASCRERV